jgi:hypothetical protein
MTEINFHDWKSIWRIDSYNQYATLKDLPDFQKDIIVQSRAMLEAKYTRVTFVLMNPKETQTAFGFSEDCQKISLTVSATDRACGSGDKYIILPVNDGEPITIKYSHNVAVDYVDGFDAMIVKLMDELDKSIQDVRDALPALGEALRERAKGMQKVSERLVKSLHQRAP